MRHLFQDARFGIRMLTSHPGFTIVAVLTLALGIASTTTVFTWIDAALLHPFPGAADPDRLAVLEMVTRNAPNGGNDTSWPDFVDYRDHLKKTSGLAVSRQSAFTIGEGERAQLAWGELVSGNYFDILGIRAVRGRTFLPEEQNDTLGAHPVVVISERLWRSKLRADPGIIGKTIRLNRHEMTVAGIVPANFRGTVPGLIFDLWVPVTMGAELKLVDPESFTNRFDHRYKVVARLAPGVTVEEARAEANTFSETLARTYPKSNRVVRATILHTWEQHNGVTDYLFKPLQLLMAAAILVLLIVCANVANLLLARSVARNREFGIRLALGAGRMRLAQQMLTETLLLAIGGSVVGIPLVLWMSGLLPALVPSIGLPIALNHDVNPRMILFVVGCCFVATVISGVVPTLTGLRSDVNLALKDGGRNGTAGAHAHRARAMLVMAEVALSAVALIGAGLFLRSFQNLRAMGHGFDVEKVLLGRFFIETSGYSGDQIISFTTRLKARLEATPATPSVSFSDFVPLSGSAGPYATVAVNGYVPAEGELMTVNRAIVDASYFQTLGIPILEGREFDARDTAQAEPVVIVNEAFTNRYFHGANPIGRQIRTFGRDMRVVGLAHTSKYFSQAEAPRPFFYLAYRQFYRATPELLAFVRTKGDPEASITALRRAVVETDPNAAAFHAVTLDEYTQVSLFGHKVATSLMAALGVMCLLLAAIGLYSVLSYSVNQRAQEIGIRMAMGARPADVIAMVVRQGLNWTLTGIAAGMLLALAATRLIGSMLVQLSAFDPLTFAGAALFLIFIAGTATALPAFRATRVDPMTALRRE